MFNKFWGGKSSFEKAIGWVKRHRVGMTGIAVHHKTKTVTPEVTGYLIESLYNAGEKELAYGLARWEISIQKPDGAFAAPWRCHSVYVRYRSGCAWIFGCC